MFAQERLATSCLANRKGMALYLVLGVLMVTVIVAGMFLNLVLSQSRLTHHTVSRTQAYYAARMGMTYAIERLSNGSDPDWPNSGEYHHHICRSGCDKNEPDLPLTIKDINISVSNNITTGGFANGTRHVNITVNYTFEQ
jgi:Tfp pilus assembly protein PilX